MHRQKASGVGRWSAVIVLTAAGTLTMGGLARASTLPTPDVSASPQPSTSAGPGAVSNGLRAPAAHGHAGKNAPCSVTAGGHLANCQLPLSQIKLPAGAKNHSTLDQTPRDLAALVDTRTWTTGGGNTFPGADVPFGMVQWSPDTLPNRNAGGGYSYTDTTLTGYSLTHLSGPGCGAAGDVPILPITGSLPSGNPNNATTAFSHANEVAQAGYYSAQSNGANAITSQFTATTHSSMGRFTFPSGQNAGFIIKLQDSQTTDTADSAKIVSNDEVSGSVTTGGFCGESNNAGQVQQYTVHFDLKFSQPFTTSQVITESGKTDPAAVYVSFGNLSSPVEAKVGISYVSSANAQLNWKTENPGWNFNAVKASAQQTWNRLLGKIRVSGAPAAQIQEFYSLLYKDFLQPNVTSDVNGQFMGADGKVHTLATGQKNQYGIYSGWDIYHSLAQLQAMLDPSAASDQAQSQVNYYSEDGLLQQWGYLNLNNYVMVGDPMQAIISDYYAFGARHFNTKQALADMVKQATTVNDVEPGAALETKYGYLPADGTYGCCNFHGVVASLLENDTADFALSNFAKSMGDLSTARMLQKRANNWENLFNPNNNLLNPRNKNGSYIPGITKLTQINGEPYYVEGDAYEYLWDTPNNYKTLFTLLGGKSKVIKALQSYLSQPNGYGKYMEITNEFDLGEQFAPSYAGDPSLTQAVVHDIRNNVYLPGPSGLANNDDLGAESSQFIWEMLGLYPENPGSTTLLLTTPGFAHAQVSLSNGKTVTINAPHASTEYYARSLRINGRPDQKLYTSYNYLNRGATLDWKLSPKATRWGSAPWDAPPSYTAGTKATVGYTTSNTVSVAPGKSATMTVGAANATNRPQRVRVTVKAPSGVTITPSSATIMVPPGARRTATLTVSAGAGTTQSYYSAPVTLTTQGLRRFGQSSGSSTETLPETVLVATPGSLLSTFNNVGISSSSNESAANFDNDGNSYSASALAADGFSPGKKVTVNGVTFTWPQPTSGFPDNTIAQGQQVTVNAPAGTQTLAFLGSARNGPASAPVTLHYSDGSTSTYWLGLTDWTLNGGGGTVSYGNKIAATTSYRNCPGCTGGTQAVKTFVFETGIPVNPGKTLTSVTLPSGGKANREHIFAIGTTTAAMTGPVVTSLSTTSAAAGQQVTIHGTGFGTSQGNGYVAFSDNGTNWGAPGNTATFTVDSWSNTAVTFTVPSPSGPNNGFRVWPGTPASVTVVDNSGNVSDAAYLGITPTANLSNYFDDTGISPNSDTSCANYDGDGYSYSAEALAAAGLTPGKSVTADGLTFTWPNVASCQPDNILAAGQTMLVKGTAGATELGLLGSSSNGPSSGTITIHYTDGTSSTQTVSFNDWANGPGGSDVAVATMPYRNQDSGGSQSITMYVYATKVPIDSAKTVASVTFPNISGSIGPSTTAMHFFAVSVG